MRRSYVFTLVVLKSILVVSLLTAPFSKSFGDDQVKSAARKTDSTGKPATTKSGKGTAQEAADAVFSNKELTTINVPGRASLYSQAAEQQSPSTAWPEFNTATLSRGGWVIAIGAIGFLGGVVLGSSPNFRGGVIMPPSQLRFIRFGLDGAATSATLFLLTAGLNACVYNWVGYAMMACFTYSLARQLLDLGFRIATRGRVSLSGTDRTLFREGTAGSFAFALAGLIGSAFACLSAPLDALHDPMFETWTLHMSPRMAGWAEQLVQSMTVALIATSVVYQVALLTRPLRRLWLPLKIREARSAGVRRFEGRSLAINEALAAFTEQMPQFIQTGEGVGKQSIKLNFQTAQTADAAESIFNGLEPADLGWPEGDSKSCDPRLFVHQAMILARKLGLTAEVVPDRDKRSYYLELRW